MTIIEHYVERVSDMQKITIDVYEEDMQKFQRIAYLWDETVENFIYDSALLRAERMMKRHFFQPQTAHKEGSTCRK